MEPMRQERDERRQKLEQLFLSALPDIDHATKFVARRHRLSPAELEDFASEVRVAIIDQDYAVLDRFQGRSSLRTYLVIVIQRLFIDRMRKRLGRWRPSTEARRLGVRAVQLEALLYRDNLTFSEACETLRTNHRVSETEATLRELAQRLPRRGPRTSPAADDEAAELRAPRPAEPDGHLSRQETSERCQRGLDAALCDLPPEDRMLIRLRFEDGVSVADIARGLGFDQKALYARIDRLLAGLRNVLVRHQLSWPEVKDLIDDGACHVRLHPATLREKAQAGPSQGEAPS
jgi:RNA polymerase sigma factor for flagellar operon FliA